MLFFWIACWGVLVEAGVLEEGPSTTISPEAAMRAAIIKNLTNNGFLTLINRYGLVSILLG